MKSTDQAELEAFKTDMDLDKELLIITSDLYYAGSYAGDEAGETGIEYQAVKKLKSLFKEWATKLLAESYHGTNDSIEGATELFKKTKQRIEEV